MDSEITYKTLYVSNIEDQRITEDDMVQLFGLAATPFLVQHCKVEISVQNGVRYAMITLPEAVSGEVTRLNGAKLYGDKIVISETMNNNDTNNNTNNNNNNTEEDNEGDVIEVQLDCRVAEWVINQVTVAEVIDAIVLSFPEDPTKSVTAMYGQRLGVYKIQSANIEPYVDSTVVIRGKELTLKAIRKRPRRPTGRVYQDERERNHRDPDGLIITMYDAFDIKFRGLQNELFDNYFHEMGVEILKPTAPQTHRHHKGVFTTNRFVVVKKIDADGNRIDFGTHIKVKDFTFKLAYYGMRSWCRLCGATHGKECPSRARFEVLKDLRKEELLARKCKIFSDSTLRQTNQLALTSDVSCMSGGGIGQLCNLVNYDEKQENIIINAGTNEIKADSPEEFVHSVNTAAQKLKALAQTTKVTLVLPDYPTNTPVEKAKKEFLDTKMSEIDEIETITLKQIEWDNQPYHRHPTEEGTRNMIIQIHEKVGGLIVDKWEDSIVSPLKYRFVQPVYKVGCRGCDNMNYVATLCDVCKNTAQNADITDLMNLVDKWEKEMYPQMEEDDDGDMKRRNKRAIQSESDDDNGNASKKKI
jgi:hypothetical protein